MEKVISNLIKHGYDLNDRIKAKEKYIDNLQESIDKTMGQLDQLIKEREQTLLAVDKLGEGK